MWSDIHLILMDEILVCNNHILYHRLWLDLDWLSAQNHWHQKLKQTMGKIIKCITIFKQVEQLNTKVIEELSNKSENPHN